MPAETRSSWLGLSLLLALAGSGCRQDMYDQPRLEPFERSSFFPRGSSARHPVPGTVAQGQLETDEHLLEGRVGPSIADSFPFEIDGAVLERGQREYSVFCSPCHGLAGYGNGSIVRRGFPQPPSFHSQGMRDKPVGHYFRVITSGFGVMFDYAAKVPPEDRWAIVAYIRALQASQNASVDEVPSDRRRVLEEQ